MIPRRFELQVVEDLNKPQRLMFFVSLSLYTILILLSYLLFDDRDLSSVIFVVSVYVFFNFFIYLRKTKSYWMIFRTFVDFETAELNFKLSTFKKEQTVLYSDINAISIKKNKVIIKTEHGSIPLYLNVFSVKKSHRIKLKFKALREELAQ